MNPGEVWQWIEDEEVVFLVLERRGDSTRILYLSGGTKRQPPGATRVVKSLDAEISWHRRIA